MPRSRPPYPPEFREQMIELVHAGRGPEQLAEEFRCSAQSIRNCVAQSAIDGGKPTPTKQGLTSGEREELARLRRQVRPAADGARHLGKGYGLVRRQERAVFELVNANQAATVGINLDT